MHFQYGAAFLSDEAWDGFQKVIADLESVEVAREAFRSRRVLMRRSFIKYVEQLWRDARKPTRRN
jgi:hypothetical protein